jgi:hypothetical protein
VRSSIGRQTGDERRGDRVDERVGQKQVRQQGTNDPTLRRSRRPRYDAAVLLAPVYGWFTEGFDTLDLKEAKGAPGRLAA